MANIDIRKGTQEASRSRHEIWDAFRSMRDLMRWDPFGATLFTGSIEPTLAPAFEVKETKDAFEFKVDVPGVDAKDLDVKLTKNRLTISGKREAEKSDKGDTYYAYERSYGSFTRSFTVPEGVNEDAVRADLKDGVLKISLQKKPEAKPRQVQIKNG